VWYLCKECDITMVKYAIQLLNIFSVRPDLVGSYYLKI